MTFTYHEDPVSTGSAVPNNDPCSICGERTDYRYRGPIYGNDAEVVCLGCIRSGRAAVALGPTTDYPAQFTDIDHDGSWANVPVETVDEILHRTPGFTGWQQERWLAHCNDACVFLGPAGIEDLRAAGDDAVDAVRQEASGYGWPHNQIANYLTSLAIDGSATAYLFKCRHCGQHLAYSDLS